MSARWKELVRLTLKGERFADHAIELSALPELIKYQQIVGETAKELWRTANPQRDRLPPGYEAALRLRFKTIEDGSATIPLEAYVEEPDQLSFDGPEESELLRAIRLIGETVECVAEERNLPDAFPKQVIPLLCEWGDTLGPDEAIGMKPAGAKQVFFTPRERERIRDYASKPYQDEVELTGTVLEADVKHTRFRIYESESDRTGTEVAFTSEQEGLVTNALKEHATRRMKIRGRGEYTAAGRLSKVIRVDAIVELPAGEIPYDTSVKPIWEILIEMAAETPEEELRKLPRDLSENLDHYLYGFPKK